MVFLSPLLKCLLVLCAPLEMSPSSLQFHVEPLALQSDANTKVSTRACLQPINFLPPSISMFFTVLPFPQLSYWISSSSFLPCSFHFYTSTCHHAVCAVLVNIWHHLLTNYCLFLFFLYSVLSVLLVQLCFLLCFPSADSGAESSVWRECVLA